ncbi:GMC oxidoreductase [Microbacterium sp. NPDC089189]|uniref:GMC oxidoreductase n=1 Tax=Microbacterium sp. NPDC089189 TaxID=3154972 RepID=UPI003427D0C8
MPCTSHDRSRALPDEAPPADVLIVGGGIMGAAVAALLREGDPNLDILMLDAGPVIGSVPGEHLHESADPEIWSRYNVRVSSGIQGLYAGDETLQPAVDDLDRLEPGMHRLGTLGQDAGGLTGAAIAWNAGGMGVHWTAATPWPAAHERFGDPARWEADLDTARRLLRVTPAPIGPTAPGERVLEVLRARFAATTTPEREPQPMPMAVRVVDGRRVRTGPATIFPPIARGDDPHFTLRTDALVTALLHEGGRVVGARTHGFADGEDRTFRATTTIVCADAFRTPQLLFASGIRPAALGRYLNEHAFSSNRIVMDLDRFGIAVASLPTAADDEFVTDSLWIPTTGHDQPYHAQVMNRTYVDDEGAPLGYGVGVSVYVPVESRAENRLVFDDAAADLTGMPRMRVEFAYSDADRALIEGATTMVAGIAAELGEWDPQRDSKLLDAGSSLHITGTVRTGDADDGTSVCDPAGRVWGYDNLYVAGNGVIPTALAANSTLTGVVTAVRAAEAVLASHAESRSTE